MNLSITQANDNSDRWIVEALDFDSEEITFAELKRRVNAAIKGLVSDTRGAKGAFEDTFHRKI